MRLELYTEKTIAQSLTALNERMQVKGTSSRPGFDGWVEKNGAFALSITTPVIGGFQRRTTLHGKMERRDGCTVIDATVPSGASKQGIIAMLGGVALMVLGMIGSGNVLFALALLPLGAYLYIPMRGDYENSSILINDLQKTLKAKDTPPKRPTADAQPRRATVESAVKPRPTATTPALPKRTTAETPLKSRSASVDSTPKPRPKG